MRRLIPIVVVGCIILGSLFVHPIPVHASTSITTYDLIALINNWRVNVYHLQTLELDSTLMGTAQYTAQLMADNNYTTHIVYLGYPGVRERIAAAGYNNGVITCGTENWAYTYHSINEIAEAWSDPDHQLPALDDRMRNVGAGVAVDASGVPWYIIHAACASSGSSSESYSVPGTPNPTADNSIHTIVASTPDADGSIYHVVESGQTLWAIAMAYNTHIDVLKELNSLSSDIVWTGMKLLIQPAPTPTVSPTVTQTPIPPTRTPTHPATPKSPTANTNIGLSSTPTPEVAINSTFSRHNLGLLIIIICGAGLLAVLAFSIFRPPSKVTDSRGKRR